jgi:hypothetical protein
MKLVILSVLSAVSGAAIMVLVGSPIANTTLESDMSNLLKSAKSLRVATDSLNAALEMAFDENGDGRPDRWTVLLRDGQPLMAQYDVSDTNSDGIPNEGSVSFGSTYNLFMLHDWDKDGQIDMVDISIENRASPGEILRYRDLNYDGQLDTLTHYLPSQSKNYYILIDGRWTLAVSGERGDFLSAHVQHNERILRFAFKDGEWRQFEP